MLSSSKKILIGFLQTPKLEENRELFRITLNCVLHLGQIKDIEIANDMSVSKTSVLSWKNGKSLPAITMRKVVIKCLIKRIEEKPEV